MIYQGTIARWLREPTQNLYGNFMFAPDDGSDEQIEVCGTTPDYPTGEAVEIVGGSVYRMFDGLHLDASWVRRRAPQSFESFWAFVKAGLVTGIGEATARKIYDHFGEGTEVVVRWHHERLGEVPGIGPKKAKDLHDAFVAKHPLIDLVELLVAVNVDIPGIRRVALEFGPDAISQVWRNPYNLVRVEGVGFRAADAVAQRIAFTSPGHERMIGALIAALLQAASNGHCFLSQSVLIAKATTFVRNVDRAAIEAAVPVALQTGELGCELREDPSIYLPELLRAEKDIADAFAARINFGSRLRMPSERAMKELIAEKRIWIDPGQIPDFRRLLAAKVGVLTGGPGVGKTTWVRSILEALQKENPRMEVALCAPTGRAARRLQKATDRTAMTIHRLLGSRDGRTFERNASDPIEADLVIVDEASMVSLELMAHLLRGVPRHAKLILVGDQDQLPSVGAGKVLADVIESQVAEVVRLTEVYRQSKDSAIPRIVARVKDGAFDPATDLDGATDISFRPTATLIEAASRIVEEFVAHCSKGVPNPKRTVQILAPTKGGEIGVHALNRRIQSELIRLGFLTRSDPEMRCAEGDSFRAGDRVMQTRNNYEHDIFNGDIGYVVSVDRSAGEVSIDFDGQYVGLSRRECFDLTLAYAITIHKSQGSEFSHVVVAIDNTQERVLNRPLVYTALSRARKRIALLGSAVAIRQAVRRTEHRFRNSLLCERIATRFKASVPVSSAPPAPKPVQTSFLFDGVGLNGYAQ